MKETKWKATKKDVFLSFQYEVYVSLPDIVILRVSSPVHFGRASGR